MTRIGAFVIAMTLGAGLHAQTQTVLHTFCSGTVTVCADGSAPFGDLIQASDGNLYGVTETGGTNSSGSVFAMSLSGTLTTVYSFCGKPACADGQQPEAGVIEGIDGNLYGTTRLGGANGAGTIFRLSRTGALTVLYSFCSLPNCVDGQWPRASLAEDNAGNLYGTAQYGGANAGGTLFILTTTGEFGILHTFCSAANCADGALPAGGLVQASNGNAYGTTHGKGSGGTVFQLTPARAFTTLYTFCTAANCPDGSGPVGKLVQAGNGNLYGVTQFGGQHSNQGTIFQITTSGQLTTLYSFCSASGCADGATPQSGLLLASDGNLYGATATGGAAKSGAVFRFASTGTFTTLYSLCSIGNCPDGYYSTSALTQASDGNLYGATAGGGGSQYAGVLFALHPSPALAAPVTLTASPSTGKTGQPITIAWSTANAFSDTARICESFVNGQPYQAVPPTGNTSFTPSAAGSYTLALTCGGTESATLNLTVQ